MDPFFVGIIVFLFVLAVFDLSVGVSNDAVNFLNSAVGTKVASYKRIILVAGLGVFIGAVMSNGMMDIARHGIFRPEYFSFFDILCICMAVMVTDIVLLDIFNNLGMPTSTTVSLVFGLLGATFATSLLKIYGGESGLELVHMINSQKALEIILGIFLSVAIAFIFGVIVQFLSRMLFSFDLKTKMKWKAGLFGGIATTAIVYFMLIKGAKSLTFMTPEVKGWIDGHQMLIVLGSLVFFSVLMQVLHWCKVNVLKVTVLLGTFALAMAFSGNDLVNFIGVPLTGFESFLDYSANGTGDPSGFMMDSLNGPASTPIYFLLAAGVVMVVSLATSPKVRHVSKTEVSLGSQMEGDEIFSSSKIGRQLVRWTQRTLDTVKSNTPASVRRWLNRRFDSEKMDLDEGAAFDLVRGTVNLMLAGVLIAVGTSLKLPLSTTFVTFMVAMGTSLADRAWSRESAVFRITGVITVIGGWFVTAFVAFSAAGLIAGVMHLGGIWILYLFAVLAIIILIRSNRRFRRKQAEVEQTTVLGQLLGSKDEHEKRVLFRTYMTDCQLDVLNHARETYDAMAKGFINEDARKLRKATRKVVKYKTTIKEYRRKQMLGLRGLAAVDTLRYSSPMHLSNNALSDINYCLRRMGESCLEHVENNFRPLPKEQAAILADIAGQVDALYADSGEAIKSGDGEAIAAVRIECNRQKLEAAKRVGVLIEQLRTVSTEQLKVMYVYLNMLQETREMLAMLHKLLRAAYRIQRPTIEPEGQELIMG